MTRPTVLLVDDDEVFLDAVTAVLQGRYEILTATSGEEAVGLIMESPPDLVVLDVVMTYPSEGYDLAATLRKNERTSRIPIIMLTGVDKMFEIRSTMEKTWVEVEAFLTKPPDFKVLLETIESLLARRMDAPRG